MPFVVSREERECRSSLTFNPNLFLCLSRLLKQDVYVMQLLYNSFSFFTYFWYQNRMVRIVDKLHKAVTALESFTTRQWHFKCDNVLRLNDELVGKDKEVSLFILSLSLVHHISFPFT